MRKVLLVSLRRPAGTDDKPLAGDGTPIVRLLALNTFVVTLNETTMINAIPRLMDSMRITEFTAQWVSTVSTAFMLSIAAVIPITGWFPCWRIRATAIG